MLRLTILFLLLLITSTAFAGKIFTKQIAADAAEIIEGNLRLPEAKNNGVRSSHALVPVNFSQSNGKFVWQGEFLAENVENSRLVVFTKQNWQVEVKAPQGQFEKANNSKNFKVQATELALGNTRAFGTMYQFTRPMQGKWMVRITSNSPERGFVSFGSPNNKIKLYSHLQNYNLTTNETIGINAFLFTGEHDNLPKPSRSLVKEAKVVLYYPGGRTETFTMYDDGRHQDEKAYDGIFGAVFNIKQAGFYRAQVFVTTSNTTRTSEHLFPVLDSKVVLNKTIKTAVLDDKRLSLTLGFDEFSHQGNIKISGEIWGFNRQGKAIPINWISTIASFEQAVLVTDGRWISKAGAKGPYTLKNLTIQDAYTNIPLATVDSIALNINKLPKAALEKFKAMDREMLIGKRPASMDNATIQSTGGKLMLVHGYCSGGVWPTSNFSDYVVFQDFDQSRSHDEFARLILSTGSSLPSFGIVAHSQGGAAALHLYTYYWSGLDYASGSRLIQSVGTPYQGTALAGSLALLGEVFGVGCGYNFDLTYDGASLWLAGIPSWARAKVNFYTTSFTDHWYYDYCHIATDLFLNDPDDGTTEKWAGQLSYGVNRGHKEGWCHTDGMRDPQQTLDSSRNYEMNTNAAR